MSIFGILPIERYIWFMGLREKKKAAKHASIIRVGWELFIREGYDRCSVEKIIAMAGIARGTFYLYFPSKKKLFDALLSEIYTPLLDILEAAEKDLAAADSSYAQQMRYLRTAMELADVLEQKKQHLILHYREAWSAGPAGESVRRWRNKLEQAVVKILTGAMEQKLIRHADSQLVAMSIVGAAERLIWAWLQGETQLERQKLAQLVADLFWQGLKDVE